MGAFVEVATMGTQQEGKLYVGNTNIAIQDAINYVKSQGGGSIFINNGIYDITQPIIIDSSNIELHGEGYHTKLKNNNVTVAINCKGTSAVKLYGIHIHDLYIGSETNTTSGANGIIAEYVGDDNRGGLKIEYNHFFYNKSKGITIKYCPNTVIADNIFYRNGSDCTDSQNSNWTIIVNNQAVSNTWGIAQATSSSVMIDGNIVSMSNAHAMYIGKAGTIITGNVINGSDGGGVYTYTNDLSIYGNTIYNCSMHGMHLTYITADSSVIANTLICNAEQGLDFGTVENSIFIGNNISKNKGGIAIWSTSKNDVFLGNRYQSYATGGTGHINNYNITS